MSLLNKLQIFFYILNHVVQTDVAKIFWIFFRQIKHMLFL